MRERERVLNGLYKVAPESVPFYKILNYFYIDMYSLPIQLLKLDDFSLVYCITVLLDNIYRRLP